MSEGRRTSGNSLAPDLGYLAPGARPFIMTEVVPKPKLPLPAKLVRLYLRSGLRGGARVTAFLAKKLPALQAVPVSIEGRVLYVDLRSGDAPDLLTGSPWAETPREADEQYLMRQVVRPGDVALDIGANIGLHTVLLSQLVGAGGRVYAFEPNAALLPTLRHTVGGLSNTTLHAVALSEQAAESVLFVPDDHTMASLADWTEGRLPGKAHKVNCQQRRLDEMIASGSVARPDFIKCDVEGAELMVFRGAGDTLNRRDAPLILFEANEHTARGFHLGVSSAMDFLRGLPAPQYSFYELRPGKILSRIDAVTSVHANILAVPRSKTELLPRQTGATEIRL